MPKTRSKRSTWKFLKARTHTAFGKPYWLGGSAGFLLFLGQYPFSWLVAFYLGVYLTVLISQKSERLPFSIKETRPTRKPFAQGFAVGMGFFVPSLYWLAHSFSVYAYIDNVFIFLILSLLAVLGLSCVLSCLFGLSFIVVAFFPTGLARLPALVALLSFSDYSRGYIATGFPWNSFGYVWGASDSLMQVASVIGSAGVGVLALLLAALTSSFLTLRCHSFALSLSLAGLVFLVGFHIWGDMRIHRLAQEATRTHSDGFRLIQPNIRQDLKWNAQILSQNLGLMLQLSTIQRPKWVRHILWPETATPFVFLQSQKARELVSSVTPENGTISLGSPRKGVDHDDQYFNSLLSLDKDSNLLANYDKQHLVPFGEYTPFGVFALNAIIGRMGAYSAGAFPQPLLDTGYFPKALVAICYEVLFSGEMLQHYRHHATSNRPQWILTISNDAWFGEISPAPYQHMSMARWRSVELGLPMARVNNTGVSAVVDALGRTRDRRDVGVIGVIDFRLPQSLREPTLYTIIGEWGAIFSMFVLFFVALLMTRSAKP